jgi:hypothetical protein
MMRNDEIGKLKYIIGELHNILWQMWDVWTEVVVASHHVMESGGLKCPKRRRSRLLVGMIVKNEA